MSSKWERASEELIQLLDTLVRPYNCIPRKMFGSPTYFVNNNMFCGVHEDIIFLRLSQQDIELLMKEEPDVSHFEPLEGRKMREYLVLDETIYSDITKLEKWLDRSYFYVSSLPIKTKK
ncbi:MAG: TfoX/Sxy family protein [Candidatus Thorarchaeota archaeon]